MLHYHTFLKLYRWELPLCSPLSSCLGSTNINILCPESIMLFAAHWSSPIVRQTSNRPKPEKLQETDEQLSSIQNCSIHRFANRFLLNAIVKRGSIEKFSAISFIILTKSLRRKTTSIMRSFLLNTFHTRALHWFDLTKLF